MKTHLIAAAIACALGAAGAWTWQANAYGARISKLTAEHTEEKRKAVERVEKERDAVITRNNELAAQVAALDERATQERENAQAENDALRSAVAAGERRLRVAAVCPVPKPASNAARTTAAARVDDATSARLTGDAEQNYWRLRGQITDITAQLTGLQAYVRALLEKSK